MPSETTPLTEMEHPRIDDDLVADRYVAGKLSAEERDRFEEHFFDCARCMETVEVVRRFRDDLREAAAGGGLLSTSVPSRVPTVLLAASLLVTAAGAAYFYREARLARRDRDAARRTSEKALTAEPTPTGALRATPLAASVFTLNLTRGGERSEPDNRVSLGAAPHWLVLLFDQPDEAASGTYRVILKAADGRAVGEPVDASATSSGLLAAGFRSDLLGPGDYTLTVERAAPGERAPLAVYRFRAAP